MSTQPSITFQSKSAPYPLISSVNYSQSAIGGNNLPISGTEISNLVYFRVYNNYGLGMSVATMYNLYLTVFDGVSAISHTGLKSAAAQSWIRIYETGFGENSLPPGLYTNVLGQDTPIGKSGLDNYVPEYNSDGTFSFDEGGAYLRAGTNENGVGFLEFATYVQVPDVVGFASYTPAISLIYDWSN